MLVLAENSGPVAGESIKAQVYRRLKLDLLAGRLRPGEYLQEKDVANSFGVSKTPIREALAELVRDGFVQLIPRKGYWVAPIDPIEIRGNIELRMILECAAAELAAQRITEEQLNNLEGLILPQSNDGHALATQEEIEEFGRTNILFHQQVASASGNKALTKMVTKVLEDLTRAIYFYYSFPTIGETAIDHIDLIEALRQRDAPLAREIVKRHLEITNRRLMDAFMGKFPTDTILPGASI